MCLFLIQQNRKNATCLLAREYALYCYGRFVSQAVGEHLMTGYYDNSGYGTAVESARSNALMRCCKDLGVASELWDLEVSFHILSSGFS